MHRGVRLDWSQTGPQGPQGLQGPQGPQGVQGPKGDPATIDNLKTIVVRKDFPIGTFDIQDGTVTCPDGCVVTGGSFLFGDGDVPISQPSGNGWTVKASSASSIPTLHRIRALPEVQLTDRLGPPWTRAGRPAIRSSLLHRSSHWLTLHALAPSDRRTGAENLAPRDEAIVRGPAVR